MKSDEYTIRPPETEEEWDVISAMLLDYRNEFNDETCFTYIEEEIDNVRYEYSAEGNHLLIAVDEPEKKIVGCVAMRTLSPGIAEMKRLYVHPSHRGKHIGENLALEIMCYAEEHECTRMVLDTMFQMHAAQHLYQQLGFSKIGPYSQQDPSKIICYEKKFV